MAITRSMAKAKRGTNHKAGPNSPHSPKASMLKGDASTRPISRRSSSPGLPTAIKPVRTIRVKNAAKARFLRSRKTPEIPARSHGRSQRKHNVLGRPFNPLPLPWSSSSESDDMEVDSDDDGELPMDIDQPYGLEDAHGFTYFHYNLSQTFDDDYLNEEIRTPYSGSITLPKLRQEDCDDGYSADVEGAPKSHSPSVQDLGSDNIPVTKESDTSEQIQEAKPTSGTEVSFSQASVRSTRTCPLASPKPIATANDTKEKPIPTPSIPKGRGTSTLDDLASSVPTSVPQPSQCVPDALNEDPSPTMYERQASSLREKSELASAKPSNSEDSEDECLVEQILLEKIDNPEAPLISLPYLSAGRIQPPKESVAEILSQAPKVDSRRSRRRRRPLLSHLKIKDQPLARVLKRCTVSWLAQEITHLFTPISGALAVSVEPHAGRASLSRAAGILRSLGRRLALVQNQCGSVILGGRRRSETSDRGHPH